MSQPVPTQRAPAPSLFFPPRGRGVIQVVAACPVSNSEPQPCQGPWHRLPCPRGPGVESSGPQFQLGDTSAVVLGWQNLSSPRPSRKRLGTCPIVLPGATLCQLQSICQAGEFAEEPSEDTGWGWEGKRSKEKSSLHPLLSKQGSVVNRSRGSDLSGPVSSLHPSTYWLGQLGQVLCFSESHW